MAVGVSSAAMLLSAGALAQEAAEAPPVTLHVDIDAPDTRIEGKEFRKTCSEPCVMKVPAGYYTVTTPGVSKEVFVDRTTHVQLTQGSPGAKTVSLVLLLTGVAITIAAFAVPLYFCRQGDRVTNPTTGEVYRSADPCRDVSDGVKVAWIAGGGAGLTLGLVGGIGLAISGPRLTLTY